MSVVWDNLRSANGLFQASFALYALAPLFFVAGWITRKRALSALAVWVVFFAFCANTAVILDRWVAAGRAPFKTLYETMLLYPWCVSAVFFVLFAMYRVTILGLFASLINAAGFGYACYKPDIEIINLPPALQSGWFVPHVVTYFIAYAALFAAFCMALLYLLFPRWRARETELSFEEYYVRSMNFGFVALTFGLVMGAVWGKYAWGGYWAWDPKENWALITWFIYVIAVHLRYVVGWKGKRQAVVTVVGFVAVVFTYLGMNLLPTARGSLHVYQ